MSLNRNILLLLIAAVNSASVAATREEDSAVKSLNNAAINLFIGFIPDKPTYERSCGFVKTIPESVKFRTKIPDRYKKYTETFGIPVVGTSNVDDRSLKRACYLTAYVFASICEIRKRYYKMRGYIIVVTEEEYPSRHQAYCVTVPTKQKPETILAETNLLCSKKDDEWYMKEEFAVHALAHTLNFVLTYVDKNFRKRLIETYNDAMKRKLWRNTYSARNYREYFAEGVQSYLGVNINYASRAIRHNGINGRSRLQRYDRKLYDFISEILTCKNKFIRKCEDDGKNTRKQYLLQCCTDGPTRTTPTIGECLDKGSKCQIYAQKGNCRNRWFKKICPASCGLCGNTQSTVPGTTTEPFPLCIDRHWTCPNKARIGLCKHRGLRESECRKSCGACGVPPPVEADCKDVSRSCPYFAKHGLCSEFFYRKRCKISCSICTPDSPTLRPSCPDKLPGCPRYAKERRCKEKWYRMKCKLSCGICARPMTPELTTETPTTTAEPLCVDNLPKCRIYAKQGRCYRRWYLKKCRRSCGKCHIHSKCPDKLWKCPIYAKQGRCTERWFKKQCRKSCGLCDVKTTAPTTSAPDITEPHSPTTVSVGTTESENTCEDVNPRLCQKNERFCSRFFFMQTKCPVTCFACSSEEEELNSDSCKDLHNSCKAWARNDKCNTPDRSVRSKCKRSCNLCVCKDYVDVVPNCAAKREKEGCDSSQVSSHIAINCQRTCDYCPGGYFGSNGTFFRLGTGPRSRAGRFRGRRKNR